MATGRGLDIGTMNIVSASQTEDGQIKLRKQRDAFLDMPRDAKNMLKLSNTSFIEDDEHLLVLGDEALQMGAVLDRPVRRPLSGGLISAEDLDAVGILRVLLDTVLGKPQEEDEVCVFSIPANPIDDPTRTNTYHEAMFERLLEDLGYDPISSNEARAVIFAECARENFSGIAFSFGAGMVNVSMVYQTLTTLEFSLARGGDWIDEQAARSVNTSSARICRTKEAGVNLLAPDGREEEAIAIFYRSLIDYTIKNFVQYFKQQNKAAPPTALPIVISGGTSLAHGFVEMFRERFEKKRKRFPIEISEIRHATSPLNAVAQGLLLEALQESGD